MPAKGPRGSAFHRSGPKHRRTKKYMETYWPYMPMLLIVVICLFIGSYNPAKTAASTSKNGVLAYATDVSPSGLLQATNAQRSTNGQAGFSLNPQLNTAAQAKANDMVNRNYWSHTTPDGQQPWIFIQSAGYSYAKAGENLAYGFLTSSDTLTGWMNSAPHKANILDTNYTDVGFGIANSPNFIGTGAETIVVAMYGQPQVLGASSGATAASPSTPTKAAAPTSLQSLIPTPTQAENTPAAETVTPAANSKSAPVSTANPTKPEPPALQITRAQAITGGKTPGIVSLLGLIGSLAILALLFRHSVELKSVIKKGERFALKHPIFDTAMVSAVMIAYVLSGTTGFIR